MNKSLLLKRSEIIDFRLEKLTDAFSTAGFTGQRW